METMGLNGNFADVLASLVYLRDQVDIGHPAIQSLSEDEYTEVYLYAEEIEQIVSWLATELMTRAAKEETLPILASSSVASSPNKDRSKMILRLSEARKKIHALRPASFVKEAKNDDQ